MPVPTFDVLITEIETGPLAAECAPYWGTTFVAPPGQKPNPATGRDAAERADLTAKASVWDVKTRRAGRLTPDAAFAIHAILWRGEAKSRAAELTWDPFPRGWKYVKRAKLSQIGQDGSAA